MTEQSAPEAPAPKTKAPREATYLIVLASLTGLGVLLPWVSFGPIGVSGLQSNQGLLALAGALMALVPAIMASSRKSLGPKTGLAAAGGGLIAAGMAVWAFIEIESDLGKVGGGGEMGKAATDMFSGIVGPGVGLYLTIIMGVLLLGFGIKVAVKGQK